MQQSTTNHQEIQKWIEDHGGVPAVIDHPEAKGDKKGIRVDFPGSSDERMLGGHETKDISWDEFFRIFDDEGLAFVYDSQPADNDPTAWYHFAKRRSD